MIRNWTIEGECPQSVALVRSLPDGATVADVGCYGWLLGDAALASGAAYIGVDQVEPPGRPTHARFVRGSDSTIDLPNDTCDLVVAGHVLEHVFDGVAFAAELLRIAKPGGRLWLETPSELGCQMVSSSDPEEHSFLSFWDDPTHVRPWTPAALYRLAISCQAVPLAIQRGQTGDVPVSTMLALEPECVTGRPTMRYVTLKGVPHGLKAAYQAVWGEQADQVILP
jgi:SAM-dependent methyltransferase